MEQQINKIKQELVEKAKILQSHGIKGQEITNLIQEAVNGSKVKLFAPYGVYDPSDGRHYPLSSD